MNPLFLLHNNMQSNTPSASFCFHRTDEDVLDRQRAFRAKIRLEYLETICKNAHEQNHCDIGIDAVHLDETKSYRHAPHSKYHF